MGMGRCLWAGWRGVAYTNVDTARRMGEGFHDQTTGSSRVGGWKFLFLPRDKFSLEGVASDLPWGPGVARAPVRGPSGDCSFVREQTCRQRGLENK